MTESTDYQGMRWFKCDLHMHTPWDVKNWRGAPVGDCDKKAAEKFIRHCYAKQLEIIAITDHNFVSNAVIPMLYSAIDTLSDKFGYRIVLFPGFEITANVGKGMHVLALFEPGANLKELEEIDHILTTCGVPMPRQQPNGAHNPSREKTFFQIIAEVQKKTQEGRLNGIIICPHPFETGIFDNDKISEWLQQHEWQNPELLAVEVPKPVEQMKPGWQRLFGNKSDCQPDWKRQRAMATIMSSDAKAFTESEDKENYIGKRFSWIKMSAPSIESLRQAFCDPTSRICLAEKPPPVMHTHIQRVSIKGTLFLQDQQIALSPHLNCLIGGRGSGKSMLFESMRLGLRGETKFKDTSEKEHVAARQIDRLRNTFTQNTSIRLNVSHNDVEDIFVVDNRNQPSQVKNRDVTDPPTVFRRLDTLIFSQEEITQLADQQKSLLDFVDTLAGDRLESPRNKAMEIVERLQHSRQIKTKLQRLDKDLKTLDQEVVETSRQLAAQATIQKELKKHRTAQEADRFMAGLISNAEDTKNRLSDIAEELGSQPPPLGSSVETFPNSDFCKEIEGSVSVAYQELAETIRAAVTAFSKNILKTTSGHPDWADMKQTIQKAEKDFHTACEVKNVSLEDAIKLKETEQQHRIKKAALHARQAERDHTAGQLPDISNLLKQLTRCWTSETRIRREFMDKIAASATMPRTEADEAIIKIVLYFAEDKKTFMKQWAGLSPRGNTRAGRLWPYDPKQRDAIEGSIGDALFTAFIKAVRKDHATEKEIIIGNPVQWLETHWDNEDIWPEILIEYKDDIDRVRKENPEQWFKLMVTRVPDNADLSLYRSDGTKAGSFQKNDLSSGQKNTAILSLLFARGTGPVLIDQPEDELDSQFLFKELVPMFRNAKAQRQLIIVTHNANIPVNADAELVYALNAENGRGVCMAEGGLDIPLVTRTVLDIMEGSEDAFRRRQEKYHF